MQNLWSRRTQRPRRMEWTIVGGASLDQPICLEITQAHQLSIRSTRDSRQEKTGHTNPGVEMTRSGIGHAFLASHPRASSLVADLRPCSTPTIAILTVNILIAQHRRIKRLVAVFPPSAARLEARHPELANRCARRSTGPVITDLVVVAMAPISVVIAMARMRSGRGDRRRLCGPLHCQRRKSRFLAKNSSDQRERLIFRVR